MWFFTSECPAPLVLAAIASFASASCCSKPSISAALAWASEGSGAELADDVVARVMASPIFE